MSELNVHLLQKTLQKLYERRQLERLIDEALTVMNEIQQEGCRAGYAGARRSENPYCKGWLRLVIPDTPSEQWDMGWLVGWQRRKMIKENNEN